MHLHASLADRDGRNACADASPVGSQLLRHAIGGLRETLGDGMAVFAPHANSYRRFRAMSYAPVAPTWPELSTPRGAGRFQPEQDCPPSAAVNP